MLACDTFLCDSLTPSRPSRRTLWLLVLIVLTFLFIGLDRVNKADDPSFEDTQAFLQVALSIRESGGFSGFLSRCLSGTYLSDLQKPLYPLLLSTLASRDLAYFPQARVLSLLIGAIVVIVFFLLATDLVGEDVALLATAGLAVNDTFLRISSHVQCEAALTLFMWAAFYCMIKGVKQEPFWLAAGFFSGLAYLTKGTGLLLIPLFAVGSIWTVGLSSFGRRSFWLFFLIFLTVSFPLIARNLIVYGEPTYEGMNNHAIWMDHWEDISLPRYQVLRQYPDVAWEGTGLPTMTTYLSSHTSQEIRQRVTTGLVREFRLFLSSMGPFIYALVLQKVVFLLFCIGLATQLRSLHIRYAALFIAAIFFPFAFLNQSVPAVRFLSVLIPIACLYAAIGGLHTFRLLMATILPNVSSDSARQGLFIFLGVCFAVIAGYLLLHQQVHWPERPASLSEDAAEISTWLDRTVGRNDLILVGENSPYWIYAWHVGMRGKVAVLVPDHRVFREGNLDLLNTLLKNPRVQGRRYVILHKTDVMTLHFLNAYFQYSDEKGLRQLQLIKDWIPVHRSMRSSSPFLIYEWSSAALK